MTYVKLFSSILASTIWQEPAAVRVVWITMLAMADRDGIVSASVPGLAKFASVDREECEEALRILMGPDEDSRTKSHEGRRIAEVEGGWVILNYEVYRDRASLEERRMKDAERQRRKYDRDKAKAKEASREEREVSDSSRGLTKPLPSDTAAAAEVKEGGREGRDEPSGTEEGREEREVSLDANGVEITEDRLNTIDFALRELGVLTKAPSKRAEMASDLAFWGFDADGIRRLAGTVEGKNAAQRAARLCGLLKDRENAEAAWDEICRQESLK